MARWPADGWPWQGQPWAQSPRPQPEMTTVRPSSRTLPTWKTDGLRLLVMESSPRQFRSRGAEPCACGERWNWTEYRQEWNGPETFDRISSILGEAASLSPSTERNE